MFFPFFRRLGAIGTKSASAGEKIPSDPDMVSAGRRRQSILQIDSFRRLWSCNILTSPMYSSVGRYTRSGKTDPAKTATDLWHGDKCDWPRPIPIWAGSHRRTWDLRRGWHSWLLSVTEENWTWTCCREVLVCVFVFMTYHDNPVSLELFPVTSIANISNNFQTQQANLQENHLSNEGTDKWLSK